MKRTHAARPPLVAAACTLAWSLAITVAYGVPRPRTHDEFAYVMQGETFALGRLTNDAHPLWRSFETFHVLPTPTYAAKYHPAQAMFLAIGELLGHRPWIGVWLSCALASAAIAWMLTAATTTRWAHVGAFIASLVIGGTYWAYSYWGGAAAALGGALVVGALLHARARAPADRATSRVLGIVAGLGTVILLLSRPLEGGLTCACLVVAQWRFLRGEPRAAKLDFLRSFVVPYGAVVASGIAFLLYYQHRVTGDALLPPYVLYERRYFSTPPFVWGRLGPEKPAPSQAFVDFATYNSKRYRETTDSATALSDLGGRFVAFVSHYVSLPLAVALPFAFRSREDEPRGERRVLVVALATIGVVLLVMLGSLWSYPHYLAPLTGLFVFVLVRGLAGLSTLRIGDRPVGRAAVVLLLVLAALGTFGEARARGAKAEHRWHQDRAALEAKLASTGEKHLVIVRYRPPHDFLEEWVYDHAAIDTSAVVFARELDPAATDALLAHYRERKAWLLTVTDGAHSLEPLSPRP